MVINNLKEMLLSSIKKYNFNFKQSNELNIKLDKKISSYYEDSDMIYYYKISMEGLKKYISILGRNPDSKEWNKYAKENGFLSSESIKYISNIDDKNVLS